RSSAAMRASTVLAHARTDMAFGELRRDAERDGDDYEGDQGRMGKESAGAALPDDRQAEMGGETDGGDESETGRRYRLSFRDIGRPPDPKRQRCVSSKLALRRRRRKTMSGSAQDAW